MEISAGSAVQFYEVASPFSDLALARQRYLQTVGFSLYHLQGDVVPTRDDYNARVMLRVDSDFGYGAHLASALGDAETNFATGAGRHYIPSLSPARVDVMYAYVEGRNVADGLLGFRVGRQYVTDVLGWWSFDGGLIRITTPYFFEVEAYAGLEQRGGLPLSTSRFEPQGVWRGSHGDFDGEASSPQDRDYPSYQFASPAPAFGFALESNGPNWLHGRATYRRVYSTGEAFTRQFPDPAGGYPKIDGTRVSSDRIGYAANASLTEIGGVKGGFAYDLYSNTLINGFAGIEAYLDPKVTIGGDFDYYEPVFDADSIWNWFSKEPVMTATGRTAIRFTDTFDLAASGGAKIFFTEGDPATYRDGECDALYPADPAKPENVAKAAACKAGETNADPSFSEFASSDEANERVAHPDGIGQLSVRWRPPTAKFELRSMVQAGGRGRRVGADLSAEKTLDGGKYAVGGRLSVYDWVDPTRENRDATSFGYVLGVGWRPLDLSRLNLEWEHDINGLVGQRFRVLASLDVKWSH